MLLWSIGGNLRDDVLLEFHSSGLNGKVVDRDRK